MPELKRISGIDINQDIDYQRREWRVQRIAWVFFAAILLASLLGLLGQGPLSKGYIGAPDAPLALRYERIDRDGAPTSMTVLLGAQATQGGKAQVSFSRDFMDGISLEAVIPEPDSAETSADAVTYTFEVKNSAQPASIRLDFEHQTIGLTHAVVRLEGGPELRFETFVWP